MTERVEAEPVPGFTSGSGPRDPRLTRTDLDVGIDLGGRYLLAAQRADGGFVYEVDWSTGEESPGDNAVRQAGATWGMALLFRETRDPGYRAALDRSLARWDADACAAAGRRWQGQHGARSGALGTMALIGLSLLERLAYPDGLTDPAATRTSLDALCAFVEDARLPGGGFHRTFDPKAGTHSGSADPYSSGEALLLFVRSGLELGLPDRVARALTWAEQDYQKFVAKPLAKEPDPDVTKGYYQWGSMSWFALASAGHAPEVWGRRLVEQALWMVDVHRTLARTRNTGYAYEGIVPAWEWARRSGDDDTAGKLAGVVHQGLSKLCSWQLGHPLASAALRSAPQRFHGAVQNHATQPALRIDVTQHQVHALMYARQFGVDAAAEHQERNVDSTSDRTFSGWAARDLAEITGGVWEIMPPEGWTMRALAFDAKLLRHQALVIPRCRTYRFGIGLNTVRNLSGDSYALLTDEAVLGVPTDIPRLRVDSVRNAVANLAVATRAAFPGRVVAVTGSAGKTTTCDMIQDMLGVFGIPKRPTRNYNGFDGVSGEVANLRNEAIAVLEVAAGYLRRLDPDLPQLRPDVALITNIGETHLEYYGSARGVAEVKSGIFDLIHRGTAVIPSDDDFYDYMVNRARQAGTATVSFGTSPKADARLLSYSPADGLVEAEIFGEAITYRLGALGRHFAHNSVGALAVIAVLGLDWRHAASAVATYTEITGRGGATGARIGNRDFTLIDDSYNANPVSTRAALEMLSQRPVPRGGRRIAVLADMLQLADNSQEFHTALADPIIESGIDRAYLVGPNMRALWDVLPSRVRGVYSPRAGDLFTVLESEIADGDVVLFKGSHGTDLHKVVAKLKRGIGQRISRDPVAVEMRAEAAPPSAQAVVVLEIPSVGAAQEVYAKEPARLLPPASLTKLLTTITALDVASRFECPLSAVLEMHVGDESGGSGKNLRVGDRFSFQDAIANMMLPSSNVTANVVARTFGQLLVEREESGANPISRFVREMNAIAASLGMADSTFVNPHGLHASAQVTTAADMAKLVVDATKRPAITKVWGRASYGMTITGPNARTQQITSSVKMIQDNGVLGGKTGSRRARSYSLAIYSETTAGAKLVSVVLQSCSDDARYADMRLVLRTLDAVSDMTARTQNEPVRRFVRTVRSALDPGRPRRGH